MANCSRTCRRICSSKHGAGSAARAAGGFATPNNAHTPKKVAPHMPHSQLPGQALPRAVLRSDAREYSRRRGIHGLSAGLKRYSRGLILLMPFHFEGFELDAAARRLSGPDGSVELPPRAFDVLLCLVSHAGERLDKAAILEAVWPNTVVEEGNLSQCIFQLRRALGDTASEP